MFQTKSVLLVLGVLLWMFGSALAAESVDDVLDQQEQYQRDAVSSQQRIEGLDDETVTLLSEYHTELERLILTSRSNISATR